MMIADPSKQSAQRPLTLADRIRLETLKLLVEAAWADREIDLGIRAARACGLMILAQLKASLGSLDKVERIVKLGGFVNSVGTFTDQPKVINGASDLMVDVFGEAGKHARSAVGVPVLPLGAAVEVDAVVALATA